MVVEFFKKIFGGGTDGVPAVSATPAPASACACRASAAESTAAGGGKPDIEGFVNFVVRALVDNPAAVNITVENRDGATNINIACEKRDIGKIIGKSGRTISAIRALAVGAAGRDNRKIAIEIIE